LTDYPPRILKITYRSGVNGRVARVFAKVEYSGALDLNEKLGRMMAKRQIIWFRVDVAKAAEIAIHRSELARWRSALANSSPITRVDWLA